MHRARTHMARVQAQGTHVHARTLTTLTTAPGRYTHTKFFNETLILENMEHCRPHYHGAPLMLVIGTLFPIVGTLFRVIGTLFRIISTLFPNCRYPASNYQSPVAFCHPHCHDEKDFIPSALPRLVLERAGQPRART